MLVASAVEAIRAKVFWSAPHLKTYHGQTPLAGLIRIGVDPDDVVWYCKDGVNMRAFGLNLPAARRYRIENLAKDFLQWHLYIAQDSQQMRPV